MTINEKIIEKIKQKTQGQDKFRRFLNELLIFETDNNGWFMDRYRKLIEEYVGEGVSHENQEN